MAKKKVVSFDLDGTLVNYVFVNSVWFEEIPRLYSIKKGISFNDALKVAKREYEKVGKERLEWYDLHYWIRKFGLNASSREVLVRFEHRIETYPEVTGVLEELHKRGFRLVIVTNANREFVELELRKPQIDKYFKHVFSSTSDFKMVKKTVNLYRRVCSLLEISPQEMIHVGDDWDFDFNVPQRLGILAFYLDRTGKNKGGCAIQSLAELNQKISLET